MSRLNLPRDVESVLREFLTCEFSTINRAGRPLTWPTLAYFDVESGRGASPGGRGATSARHRWSWSWMVWDSRLAARARLYSNAILTVVDSSGYSASVRCTPTLDEHSHTVSFEGLAAHWTGPAALLFHRHNARLEDQYQLLIRGELVREGSSVKLVPSAFVTANGSRSTDRMPHAGAPLQLLRFLFLGRRLARQYLARHNPAPWPIGFDELVRIAEESTT